MHDCVLEQESIIYIVRELLIRVTAVLEYFKWTPSKQHSRSKGKGYDFSVPLFDHASG